MVAATIVEAPPLPDSKEQDAAAVAHSKRKLKLGKVIGQGSFAVSDVRRVSRSADANVIFTLYFGVHGYPRSLSHTCRACPDATSLLRRALLLVCMKCRLGTCSALLALL